jgi:hypothetical protein
LLKPSTATQSVSFAVMVSIAHLWMSFDIENICYWMHRCILIHRCYFSGRILRGMLRWLEWRLCLPWVMSWEKPTHSNWFDRCGWVLWEISEFERRGWDEQLWLLLWARMRRRSRQRTGYWILSTMCITLSCGWNV